MIDLGARRVLLWSCLLLALAPATVSAQAATDSAQLPATLHAARAQWLTAILTRDGAAAAAVVADSAVAEFDVERFTGKAAFVDGFLIPQLQALRAVRFGPVTFSRSGGDILETRTYFVTPVDVADEVTGQSTTHWRQVVGEWRVVRLVVQPAG